MTSIALDISTAAIAAAADFIDEPQPPANYKKAETIAAWNLTDKPGIMAERVARASLDLDLCQVTGYGWFEDGQDPAVVTMRDEESEKYELCAIALGIKQGNRIVTYNGRGFDIPVLKRRARYLGVDFPDISTDRFKSPIVDLMTLLSDNDPSRRRSLSFYCKRLGWADLCDKPLSGADEARVVETGAWAELEASLTRDVTAIKRLAEWLGAW